MNRLSRFSAGVLTCILINMTLTLGLGGQAVQAQLERLAVYPAEGFLFPDTFSTTYTTATPLVFSPATHASDFSTPRPRQPQQALPAPAWARETPPVPDMSALTTAAQQARDVGGPAAQTHSNGAHPNGAHLDGSPETAALSRTHDAGPPTVRESPRPETGARPQLDRQMGEPGVPGVPDQSEGPPGDVGAVTSNGWPQHVSLENRPEEPPADLDPWSPGSSIWQTPAEHSPVREHESHESPHSSMPHPASGPWGRRPDRPSNSPPGTTGGSRKAEAPATNESLRDYEDTNEGSPGGTLGLGDGVESSPVGGPGLGDGLESLRRELLEKDEALQKLRAEYTQVFPSRPAH